ncbi:MAG: glycogen/starch synthase [Treponema sp.]|nr:glycogen/starch synthase [Treponema sp.]
MKLWFVSMECANIAEAGGVKNVTFSLCKEFAALGHDVSLFIPVFKCNSWEKLSNIQKDFAKTKIQICKKEEKVSYTKAVYEECSFDVILINHPVFAEKEAVYTYTANEEKLNPKHKKGEGHEDFLLKDALFQKSVCSYLSLIDDEDIPQIIHCQDASTALLPAFISQTQMAAKIKTLVTIHNAGPFYHHEYANIKDAEFYTNLPEKLLEASRNGERIEPFLIAANAGAKILTVSRDYAKELKDPFNIENTDGLSKIFYKKRIPIKGITNGFDFNRYNPANTELSKLPYAFNPETGDLEGKYKSRQFFIDKVVNSDEYPCQGIKKYGSLSVGNKGQERFVAYHGRITSQKGINILIAAIPNIIKARDEVRFVIAGQGEPGLEEQLAELTKAYPGKIVYLNGYNQAVVRMAIAACDFIALPSYFEPCGLEDFIAQAFGTLPLAHKTGGLKKILNNKSGFLYKENTNYDLEACILKALSKKTSKINKMIIFASNYVHKEYVWTKVVGEKYLKFFKKILRKR